MAAASALVLAAVLAGTGATVRGAGRAERVAQQIDDVFAAWQRADSPGCAVSVMRGARIEYAAGYGTANLEYDVPITPSTVFQVASVSKQFTAMAVALLVADGLVSWDDDIRRHVPELPQLGGVITLRHLAHHTSGIRDQWSLLRMAGWRWGADLVTQDDVLDVLSRQTALNFPPGREYLYSNSGYTPLAVVVERVSGRSLRHFTRARIFEPLGMTSTQFRDDTGIIVKNRAAAYAPDGTGAFRISIPDFNVVGATSLYTTVEDLARWNHNFDAGAVGGPAVVRQVLEMGRLSNGERLSYAFGLVHETYRGRRVVGHGGNDAGYRSEFVRVPDENLGVAVLCNVETAEPRPLARAVLDVVLPPADGADAGPGLRATDGPAADGGPTPAPTADLLARAPGYYRRKESDVPLRVVVRGGGLALQSDGLALTLHALGPNRFRLGRSATVMTFEPGTDGLTTTLHLSGPTQATYTRSAPARPAADWLAGYRGAYFSDELAVQYVLRVENGRLVLWNRKLGDVPLQPTFADGFYGTGWHFTFRRNDDGTVAGFTMSTPRAWNIAFRKFV